MEKMGHRDKFWAVALLIAIVVVLSSMGGTLLLQKERATGGMDVLWKQTNTGTSHDVNVYWINDSAIINDLRDKEIRCISSDGSVAWSYPYTDASLLIAQNDQVCFIDDVMITCLDHNGSLEWRLPDPWVNETSTFPSGRTFGIPEADGNTYLFGSTARSVMCIDGQGTEKWTYTVDNGAIGSSIVYSDGTALIAHTITNVSSLNSGRAQLGNGEEIIGKELICISPNGTVLGKMEIPGYRTDIHQSFEQAANGTATFCTLDFNNSTRSVIGLSNHLAILWAVTNIDLNAPVQGEGSVIYYLEHRTVDLDSYGNTQALTTLCVYNTTSGVFLCKIDFPGSFSGGLWVNGDTAFLSENNKMWAVGPDGHAQSVITSGWFVLGTYGDGILLRDDIGFRLIGPEGSKEWQYDLDTGVIQDVHVASDGTIMVWANDGLTAIHKPAMSSNMMYLVGLVTFDLLVILIAGIWIQDRRSPRERKTP
jgi:hypothetical protein